MNQEIQLFQNEQFKVRAVEKDGKAFFIAKDVAEVLGYKDTAYAIITHCKGVGEIQTPTSGGVQKMKIIPESDIYRLIIRSRLPEAEKFEKWIMEEVLPSINKRGAYLTPDKIEEFLNNPDTIINLATQLKKERKEKLELEEQRKKDAPKLEFYEDILNTNSLIDMQVFSKLVKIGSISLFEILRQNNIFFKDGKHNLPYQSFIDRGYFEVKETKFMIADKEVIYPKIHITGKGQTWLHKWLKEKGFIEKAG